VNQMPTDTFTLDASVLRALDRIIARHPTRITRQSALRLVLERGLASLDVGEPDRATAVVTETTEADYMVAARRLARAGGSSLVDLLELRQAVGAEPSVFKRLTIALARAGKIELRPESGIGTLRPADHAWLNRTRDGQYLSMARLT
jgi:hypothetical protein